VTRLQSGQSRKLVSIPGMINIFYLLCSFHSGSGGSFSILSSVSRGRGVNLTTHLLLGTLRMLAAIPPLSHTCSSYLFVDS
jgi:hypothetical protein